MTASWFNLPMLTRLKPWGRRWHLLSLERVGTAQPRTLCGRHAIPKAGATMRRAVYRWRRDPTLCRPCLRRAVAEGSRGPSAGPT